MYMYVLTVAPTTNSQRFDLRNVWERIQKDTHRENM